MNTNSLTIFLGMNAEYGFIFEGDKPTGEYYMLAPFGPWNTDTALADAKAGRK